MILVLLADIVTAKSPGTPVDPKTLLAAANCYACYGTPNQVEYMKLALLAQIIAIGG